jgi:hypothetical protein
MNQRRRPLAEQLQERNQGILEAIERLNQELALNEQIIEELLRGDPSDKSSSEEEYVDSAADTETFSDIASVEIVDPPPNYHPQTAIGRQVPVQKRLTLTTTPPAAVAARASSAEAPASASKPKGTSTPKKRTKKDERKESLEKARAWAIDRKNAREERDKGR